MKKEKVERKKQEEERLSQKLKEAIDKKKLVTASRKTSLSSDNEI